MLVGHWPDFMINFMFQRFFPQFGCFGYSLRRIGLLYGYTIQLYSTTCFGSNAVTSNVTDCVDLDLRYLNLCLSSKLMILMQRFILSHWRLFCDHISKDVYFCSQIVKRHRQVPQACFWNKAWQYCILPLNWPEW